jgi:glycosyltransferase involved in cell wall biosynthesis
MSTTKTKVSVIIPVHDHHPHYLEKCLNSVINQTLKEIQIICIDDDSDSETKKILGSFAKKDKRIKIIATKKTVGPWNARNLGLKKVKGEYIAFVDSDDYVGNWLLSELYKKASEKKLDVLSQNFRCHTKNGLKESYINPEKMPYAVYTGKEFYEKIVSQGNYAPAVWARIIKTSFLKKNKIQFGGFPMSADHIITSKILLKAKRVSFVNLKQYFYRIHQGSITHTKITTGRLFTITRVLNEMYNTANKTKLDVCFLDLYNYFVYLARDILIKAKISDLKRFTRDTKPILFSPTVQKQKRRVKLESQLIIELLKIAYNYNYFFIFIRVYMFFRVIFAIIFRRMNSVLKSIQKNQSNSVTTNH